MSNEAPEECIIAAPSETRGTNLGETMHNGKTICKPLETVFHVDSVPITAKDILQAHCRLGRENTPSILAKSVCDFITYIPQSILTSQLFYQAICTIERDAIFNTASRSTLLIDYVIQTQSQRARKRLLQSALRHEVALYAFVNQSINYANASYFHAYLDVQKKYETRVASIRGLLASCETFLQRSTASFTESENNYQSWKASIDQLLTWQLAIEQNCFDLHRTIIEELITDSNPVVSSPTPPSYLPKQACNLASMREAASIHLSVHALYSDHDRCLRPPFVQDILAKAGSSLHTPRLNHRQTHQCVSIF